MTNSIVSDDGDEIRHVRVGDTWLEMKGKSLYENMKKHSASQLASKKKLDLIKLGETDTDVSLAYNG